MATGFAVAPKLDCPHVAAETSHGPECVDAALVTAVTAGEAAALERVSRAVDPGAGNVCSVCAAQPGSGGSNHTPSGGGDALTAAGDAAQAAATGVSTVTVSGGPPGAFPENWMCLAPGCGVVSCSRYVHGHAATHRQSSDPHHCVAVSFSDLSVWCYACDSYVANPRLAPLLRAFSDAKEKALRRRDSDAGDDDDEDDEDFGVAGQQQQQQQQQSKDVADAALALARGSDDDDDDDDDDGASSSSSSSEGEGGGGDAAAGIPPSEDQLQAELLARKMAGVSLDDAVREQRRMTLLGDDLTLEGVAGAIREGRATNLIIMGGAGVSVSAGIPDFRTPGTGLYDNLQKYNLPEPTAIFELGYYREHPEPFALFAKEIYPGNYRPTLSHYFCRLLHDKGILLRHFTQNIDTLERVAGIPNDSLVEAHGSFHGAKCIDCFAEADQAAVKADFFADRVPHCVKCGGLVKPNIVFFGEGLPERFFHQAQEDFPKCDMLLVMGTSLQVHPFAGLIHAAPALCPRVLINREAVATADRELLALGMPVKGFRFKAPQYNVRDVAALGDLDDVVWRLTNLIGKDWADELVALIRKSEPDDSTTITKLNARLAAEADASSASTSSSSSASAAAAAAGGQS